MMGTIRDSGRSGRRTATIALMLELNEDEC
jgi:hypothetical protein